MVAPRELRGQVFVDDRGVMRWSDSSEEVSLFGVNYGVPFAHGYRALGYLGLDRKAAIDADVSHFKRLGLDAFRVHVWDREITDRDGRLIENDHLDLLDYLIAQLSRRGIKTILTPIAWWGAGYPEPDPETSGISDFYSKGEMTTDPEARKAQVRYMKEFIAHRNPYSGLSYNDDPDIIAIELFNEPSHPGGSTETTRFIDELADALRSVGLEKPIFYNISQGYSDDHGLAVCAADIDGVSVQWYPTGLVRNAAIAGNMLPNVDSYPLPFENFPDCRNKARMVYEFDAADVAGSYMYPAMARSFRGAGFQWATQFAYDPLGFAFANTDYQTHFLNLVYTPGKAVSFMIAGEVFRRIPRGASYGVYPASATFEGFRVSYEEDLSELVADTVFFHSNRTTTLPPRPELLRHVAGVGQSAVVSYSG
ncbi:MAG: cellulase family glycosylhydrolase, partial [Rhodothermales bacterium]|nr:cellulase family glycosylhydrolase [Rhodothermales bacterium]